ncbi:DNA primase small subunit domain-containing protein [Infirmifilum uzonense]|uniref:DNA primase small subunit domain-containing protein n=1 Tax=Infirmifilum uzonense TaxID=1550241 RepID=UPI0006998B15|nr:DNA primase small subunit PriS [Infirmifilum uzonense]
MDIQGLFKEYYRKNPVPPPPSIERREFAFTTFSSSGMIRHISFKNPEEMNRYIIERIPRHAYYSTAYYSDPSAPEMEDKGWQGADMVFDIDVDHIDTPCKPLHDTWRCKACGAHGRGLALKCPVCGSESLERQTWVCDRCISVAREEALKLIDILEEDLGISRSEMIPVFSGHRGFHIHVEDKALIDLEQEARREIADYVRGLGIDPDLYIERTGDLYKYKYPSTAPGWRGRIAMHLALRGKEDTPLPREELKKLIMECVAEARANIDEKVTMDVKRLIRLPGTLHGKTGLKVLPLTIQQLEAMDAASIIERAVALPDTPVSVEMEEWPRRVLGFTFSEDGSKKTVPLYLAVYLVLNSPTARILSIG